MNKKSRFVILFTDSNNFETLILSINIWITKQLIYGDIMFHAGVVF